MCEWVPQWVIQANLGRYLYAHRLGPMGGPLSIYATGGRECRSFGEMMSMHSSFHYVYMFKLLIWTSEPGSLS